eukprot:10553824-Karenia_brevis.AAC.1
MTPREEALRQSIKKCDMGDAEAHGRLDNLDPAAPYYNKESYIADLAALCSVFKDEVTVKTAAKSKFLNMVLWSATAPGRIGFFMNNMIRKHMMSKNQRAQLSSGTSGNESLNKEANNWFKNYQQMYQSTVYLGLKVFQFFKLVTHHSAEYDPTDVQVDQLTLMAHIAGSWEFSQDDWRSILEASLPLEEKRTAQQKAIKRHQLQVSSGLKREVKKKPAGPFKKPSGKTTTPVFTWATGPNVKVKKTHTFNKTRR